MATKKKRVPTTHTHYAVLVKDITYSVVHDVNGFIQKYRTDIIIPRKGDKDNLVKTKMHITRDDMKEYITRMKEKYKDRVPVGSPKLYKEK